MTTFEQVRQAVALTTINSSAAQMQMAPEGRERLSPDPNKPPRPSAVMVLVHRAASGGLHIVLTRRTAHLSGHSGQISFPGGKRDPDDDTYEDCATRETCEELGICDPDDLAIVGRMGKLWIPPSNYSVVPVVATLPQLPPLQPSPYEVAEVLSLSLRELLDPATKRTKPMTFRGTSYDVPYYNVDGHVVWGATAMMLSELEARLRRVLA